ncbi:response regulator transcription factor [Mangrovicella endophytica]|uniref:response regulator transcription factor n=1 Tax=Mangrovicella endophytica TaxID=2066697 RepID=UPI000C9EA60B|nr:response regulator transcription factor [Mangrovicella endophytica]
MAPRILVVDDDPHIRDVICFALEKAGMQTETAPDGASALRQVQRRRPDLVVLDIGMPELDGLDVCRELRKTSTVPILFLSARDEEIDRILGLEIGGDDYVTKPFSPRELVARVKVILRRLQPGTAEPEPVAPAISHGRLTLDPAQHTTTFDGRGVELTSTEFAILRRFLMRPSHVVTRQQIMEASHADGVHVSDRTIDSHIRNIRFKFGAAGGSNVVETVHGVGFRLGRCDA